ncbi:MAG: hypothetical protein AAGD34_03710, partial [Pseudomonadota bacterium]
ATIVAGELDVGAAATWLAGASLGRGRVMAEDISVLVEGLAEGRITTLTGAQTDSEERVIVTGTDVSALVRTLLADESPEAPAMLATAATVGPLMIPLPNGDQFTIPFVEATNVALTPVSSLTPQQSGTATSAMDLAGLMMGLFSADEVEAQNITHTSGGIDTKIDRVALSELTPEGFGAFALDGFSTTDTTNIATLTSLSINDVAWAKSRFGVGPDVAAITAASPVVALAGYPQIGSFSVEGMVMEGPTMEGGVSVPSMTMRFADHIGPIPTNVTYDVETVVEGVADTFPPDIDRLLASRGYETFDVRESGILTYDRSTEALTIKTKSDYERLGVLDMHLVVSGIPVLAFEEPARAFEAISLAAIADMSLSFQDKGAIDLLKAVFSHSSGTADNEVLPQWMGMARGVISGVVPEERAEPILAAIETFLTDTGTITMTAEPPSPVSFMQLATGAMTAPGQILNILNVTVSADR